MNSRDFCYWLQGLFEVGQPTTLNANQIDLIKRHLAMVFLHEIDPSFGPKQKQDALNDAHESKPKPPKKPPPDFGGHGPGGTIIRC